MTPRGHCVLSRVEELIDPLTGNWDEYLIRDNFREVDVERILHIPLPNFGQSDFIAWQAAKSGCFSVKSAYHLEWRAEYRRRAQRVDSSDRSSPHVVWKKIWSAKVSRKVQIFNWRALHGIIPCLCTLANRHIGSSVNCPVCNVEAEDLRHMLFKCDRATEIWEGLGLGDAVKAASRMELSGSVVLEELLCSPTPGGITCNVDHVAELVMTACWYLWWSRRQIKNKEPVPTAERSIINISGIMANSVKIKGSGNAIRRGGWTKPATGVYKLNIDAAFDSNSGRGASGAIIRDAGGNFMAAACDYTDRASDAESMEASALLAGLKLADQFNAQSLVVESDCMEVVMAVLNPNEYRGTSAVVIDDCRHLLMVLGMATLQHCPREANEAAHVLARHGSTSSARVFWFSDPPAFLIPVLVDDRVVIS
jgi:ribonuclease HI